MYTYEYYSSIFSPRNGFFKIWTMGSWEFLYRAKPNIELYGTRKVDDASDCYPTRASTDKDISEHASSIKSPDNFLNTPLFGNNHELACAPIGNLLHLDHISAWNGGLPITNPAATAGKGGQSVDVRWNPRTYSSPHVTPTNGFLLPQT
ncbi:uncharacterized protein LOC129602315 [Paramacrobiotus metropolitanus]|uniref:uncharacterized protein LOC129602315 n=1 Tax=Paramacrobiotus metropolitanus TaxID=2943436 RepID=UPI0024459B68|nr:uncharacterized protein LOC129602315 [Paramacrobiotus metropolitanus]